MVSKQCPCGLTFIPNSSAPWQKYCDSSCRRKFYRDRFGKTHSTGLGLCSGIVGAISEHQVVADLFLRGYEVFRACSPSAPCDLIAMKSGKILRIEVKTVGDGEKYHQSRDSNRQDVFAFVSPLEIVYEPTLEG